MYLLSNQKRFTLREQFCSTMIHSKMDSAQLSLKTKTTHSCQSLQTTKSHRLSRPAWILYPENIINKTYKHTKKATSPVQTLILPHQLLDAIPTAPPRRRPPTPIAIGFHRRPMPQIDQPLRPNRHGNQRRLRKRRVSERHFILGVGCPGIRRSGRGPNRAADVARPPAALWVQQRIGQRVDLARVVSLGDDGGIRRHRRGRRASFHRPRECLGFLQETTVTRFGRVAARLFLDENV